MLSRAHGALWSVVVAVVMAVAVPAAAGPLQAGEPAGDEESSESVGGTLTISDDDSDERRPVPGVRIFVVDESGTEVGSAESGDDGVWEVTVPAPGSYDVSIDPESLPDGIELRDADRATLPDVSVREGQTKVVTFLFGDRPAGTGSDLDRFINLVASGIKFGSVIALTAVGLSLIFGVTGLVNFAHGELVAFGAVFAWFLNASAGGPQLWLVWATPLAMVAALLLGCSLELGLWRPLRRAQISGVTLLVVAIGLSLLLRYVILIAYGGASRPYADFTIQRGFDVGPITMPAKDYAITAIALLVLMAVGLLLVKTRIGTAMRAVADNRDLAESSGIDVERVILFTWALGASLACLGGVLQGVTEAVSWDMGFALLLLMFAAVILGGLGTAFGAMVGGLVIGLVAQVSTYWVSTEFKLAIALGVLIIVLLVRPQGILGRAERIG